MAFPTNAVLDTFNAGANQALTARAGWAAGVFLSTQSGWTTDATPTKAVGSTAGGNVWTLSSVSNMEAYCTLLQWSFVNNEFNICARIQVTTGSPTHYSMCLGNLSSTGVELVAFVAGVRTVIASTTRTHTDGDSYGITVIGTTITGYAKTSAGAWGSILTTTDSTITGNGNIGFRTSPSGATWVDDFGGGAVSAPAPVTDTMAWPMSSYGDSRHGVAFG